MSLQYRLEHGSWSACPRERGLTGTAQNVCSSNKKLIWGGCFPFYFSKRALKNKQFLRLKTGLISPYTAKYISDACKYLISEYKRALINTESINNLKQGQEGSVHFAWCGVFFIQLDEQTMISSLVNKIVERPSKQTTGESRLIRAKQMFVANSCISTASHSRSRGSPLTS